MSALQAGRNRLYLSDRLNTDNSMNKFISGCCLALASNVLIQPAFAQSSTETLVFVRHGEKPSPTSFGQLTCQGLNRALALPDVLISKYLTAQDGTVVNPAAIYAPDPGYKNDNYYYVRPLATIEPTAIRLVMPVNTQFAYNDDRGLETELLQSSYQTAAILIAWEHANIYKIVKSIVASNNGNPNDVPVWDNADYDSIYVVTIHTDSSGKTKATFQQNYESLNGQSTTCPS
jgi:hypothetical protein